MLCYPTTRQVDATRSGRMTLSIDPRLSDSQAGEGGGSGVWFGILWSLSGLCKGCFIA